MYCICVCVCVCICLCLCICKIVKSPLDIKLRINYIFKTNFIEIKTYVSGTSPFLSNSMRQKNRHFSIYIILKLPLNSIPDEHNISISESKNLPLL